MSLAARQVVPLSRSRHDWYITASHGKLFWDGPELRWRPLSVTHAKRFGTNFTACGERAYSWHKEWARPFASTDVACAACLDALRPADM
ncbi:hypothetical protein JOD65_000389 [Nocardioides cavernae]|nr:hypothetical protein [Nocardioides cavernae]